MKNLLYRNILIKLKIMKSINKINITIFGLGYVGLPLMIELSKKFKTIGFDINKSKILELKKILIEQENLKNHKLKI